MLRKLRPLFPYFRRYRWKLILGALCVFGTQRIWVQFPKVLEGATNTISRHGVGKPLWVFALLLIAIAAGKGIFQFLTRWIMIGVSRDIEYDLRNDMFRRL